MEIVNPALHIATLTHRDARIEMEITARRGRGYSTTESREHERHPLGTMSIDAVFTPIRNVGFRVENTRVGDITNYDRLTLTVETDGTIRPEDAVRDASQMIIDHFRLILEPPVAPEPTPTEAEAAPEMTASEPAVLPPDDQPNEGTDAV